MFFNIISSDVFLDSGRWDSNYFNIDKKEIESKYDLVKLSDVVKERKQGIECKFFPEMIFNYIGMENIEPDNCCLIDFTPKLGIDIKSRSKVFRHGDVIYGKLRPNLNKVYTIDDVLNEGVCSSEFFVLVSTDKILPVFLEIILSSKVIKNKVISLVSGATLPRVSIKELMELKIPLPPIEEQMKIIEYYVKIKGERVKAKIASDRLIGLCRESIIESITSENDLNFPHINFEKLIWDNPLPDLEL
ncbi:TPA: restriction endonuclease subunit S [Photobacterium damselae]